MVRASLFIICALFSLNSATAKKYVSLEAIMKKLSVTILLLCFSITTPAQTTDLKSNIILAQSNLNCGLKPLPRLGHRIGRCVNGEWEQVSTGSNSNLNCGLKPLPRLGHRIGRCINGEWEQVSN